MNKEYNEIKFNRKYNVTLVAGIILYLTGAVIILQQKFYSIILEHVLIIVGAGLIVYSLAMKSNIEENPEWWPVAIVGGLVLCVAMLLVSWITRISAGVIRDPFSDGPATPDQFSARGRISRGSPGRF